MAQQAPTKGLQVIQGPALQPRTGKLPNSQYRTCPAHLATASVAGAGASVLKIRRATSIPLDDDPLVPALPVAAVDVRGPQDWSIVDAHPQVTERVGFDPKGKKEIQDEVVFGMTAVWSAAVWSEAVNDNPEVAPIFRTADGGIKLGPVDIKPPVAHVRSALRGHSLPRLGDGMADGLHNAEIAQPLELSEKTLRNHIDAHSWEDGRAQAVSGHRPGPRGGLRDSPHAS
jgi:hypothetical protein